MLAFAVTQPGLGPIVAGELKGFGMEGVGEVEGGVEFIGDWPAVWRANLLSRTASRVLLRVGEFPAVSLPELERKLKRLPWREWLPQGAAVQASAACRKSRLMHTGRIEEILAGVAEAALGQPPEGAPKITAHLRFYRDVAVVSLDTSGEHLHRRGYRQLAGEAPIRENLAAACLMSVGYTGDEPLIDPCCGSGTFPVEAALMAMGIPPGLKRPFAFEHFSSFDRPEWEEVKARALEGMRKAPERPIYASDADPGAVSITVASARAAGVADHVQVAVSSMEEFDHPPEPTGLVVANPPYGRRLGGGGAYRALRGMLTGPFAGWRWGVVECARRGMGRLNLEPALKFPFSGGGLKLAFASGGPFGGNRGRIGRKLL